MTSSSAGTAISGPAPDSPRRVFVLGAGIMGSGIAAQCALAGHAVILEDVTPALAEKGLANATRALGRLAERSPAEKERVGPAAARIRSAVGFAAASDAELLIEAAPEDLTLKRKLFAELEPVVPRDAILASNTSSLPITSIGRDLADPGRLVGLHFFNPVLQMPLVELISGVRTRSEVVDRARAFAAGLGKTVVHSADAPGFVTSRALAVLLNEAAWMLYEHVSTKEEIDAAYKLGFHHPMGPFELADLVGVDTTVAILDVLWDGFRDSRYRACPLLRSMVAAGKVGRKSGEGFYPYPARGSGA